MPVNARALARLEDRKRTRGLPPNVRPQLLAEKIRKGLFDPRRGLAGRALWASRLAFGISRGRILRDSREPELSRSASEAAAIRLGRSSPNVA